MVRKMADVRNQSPGQNKAPRDYRFALFRALVVAGSYVALFLFGRRCAESQVARVLFGSDPLISNVYIDQEPDRREVLRFEVGLFQKWVDSWNNYLISHNGEFPPDPYMALLSIEGNKSVYRLREIEFNDSLPPKINSELRRNDPKWVVFVRRYYFDRAEEWQCYADGTWQRVKLPAGATPAPATFGMSFDPRQRLRDAGYPVDEWKTDSDRATWLSQNEDRLVWYPPWRMYVVRGATATRPGDPNTRPDAAPKTPRRG
jgi:hypothetical protein